MHLKRVWVVVIILAVLLFLVIGILIWRQVKKSATSELSASGSTVKETWVKVNKKLFENTTSTSALKLDDGTYRMYLMKDGEIKFANSKDASMLEAPVSTGITADQDKFISNPAVLKIKDGDWIMIYEQAPILPANSVKGAGKATERDLLLATSADGKTFQKAGEVINSNNKDNKFFASVPNLVKVSDNLIRLYYVSQGDKIASATSVDGRTWKKEDGFRMEEGSVDPDVLLKINSDSSQQWVMYFATLEGAGNKIYKATSTDGLTWKKGEVMLRPNTSSGVVVDPDVVQISEDKYRMFFGESTSGNAQMNGGGQIDLYYADDNTDILDNNFGRGERLR